LLRGVGVKGVEEMGVSTGVEGVRGEVGGRVGRRIGGRI
jgi:hypothetical protein